jgi:hypothetical protein
MRRFLAILIFSALAAGGCATSTRRPRRTNSRGPRPIPWLTDDVESVAGRCHFVRNIVADDDPGWRPTDADLPAYFRTEAVYRGADTVVVRGRVGEAYICGPGPLNPDGTLQSNQAGPH